MIPKPVRYQTNFMPGDSATEYGVTIHDNKVDPLATTLTMAHPCTNPVMLVDDQLCLHHVPSRLLDIQDKSFSTKRLRLIQSNELNYQSRYTTPSFCWGSSQSTVLRSDSKELAWQDSQWHTGRFLKILRTGQLFLLRKV